MLLEPKMLEDIESIKQIKGAYGDIIDRLIRDPEPNDREELAALFSEDAVLDYHEMLGKREGIRAIVRFFAETMSAQTAWMWHSFHSPISLSTVTALRNAGFCMRCLSRAQTRRPRRPRPTAGL